MQRMTKKDEERKKGRREKTRLRALADGMKQE